MAPTGPVDSPRIDHWSGGLTWRAHPDETMQRASHALEGPDGIWLVDPLEAAGVHDAIAELGDVVGVVVLLDRHRRDAADFAARYDVSVSVPAALGDALDNLGVPVHRFDGDLGETGYRARPVVVNRLWREAILVHVDGETAIVPEALGTSSQFTAPGERVGVHPVLRLWPPRRRLGDLDPERLVVGHGPPLLDGAGPAIREALAGARRRAPQVYWRTLVSLVRK